MQTLTTNAFATLDRPPTWRAVRASKIARVSLWASTARSEAIRMDRALRQMNPGEASCLAPELLLDRREWEAYASGQRIAQPRVVDPINALLSVAGVVYNHSCWKALHPETSGRDLDIVEIEFRDNVDLEGLIACLGEPKWRRRIVLKHPLDGITRAIVALRQSQRKHDSVRSFLLARVVLQELIYLALRDDYRCAYLTVWNALCTSLLYRVCDGEFRVSTRDNCLGGFVAALWERLAEIRRLARGRRELDFGDEMGDATIADLVSEYVVLLLTPGIDAAESLRGRLRASRVAGSHQDDQFAVIVDAPILENLARGDSQNTRSDPTRVIR